MARTTGEVRRNGEIWTLSFEDGWEDWRIRVGGFFAGYDSKEGLKQELRRQFWEQEQTEVGENLGHYLVPQTTPASIEANMNSVKDVKDVKGGRRKRVSRDAASLDHGEGDRHAQDGSALPVSYVTRAAEKRSKLKAAEKRKLAALEKRRFWAAQKKRKIANDHELDALGRRKAVTRSRSNL